jgi:hypothetical protein
MALSACATTQRSRDPSFPALTADPKDSSLLWWEREGFDWSSYHAVILEPVAVRLAPQTPVPPQDAERLGEALRAAVVAELTDHYPITDTAAPGVLRIRCALTDVKPGNSAVNVVTSLVAFVPMDIGGASIEVEFIDAMTGERVAAGTDSKRGSVLPGLEGLTRYGHAQQAFREWAHELRAALESNL